MTQPCEESPQVVRIATGSDPQTAPAVLARMPQGIETSINIRILPERSLEIDVRPVGCQPRQGAPRRDVDTVPLPPALPEKLKAADKAVIAWLARDAANASAFISNPVAALVEIGVDLDRSDLKAIGRAHQVVRDAAVLPPGTAVSGLSVAAFDKGRIGQRPTTDASGKTPDC